MTCTAVSTLKGSPQLPMLPSQPPTTSSGWQALRIIIQTILQQIQGAAGATGVNVIPQQYALFGGSILPPMTATNCTVALDTSTVLFGKGSLKITITGANASVNFGSGFPLSPYSSWLISFFTQASAQVAGSITITTPANTYTTDFTSPTGSGWQRLYDTLNLIADASTSFGVSFAFPNASGQTVWIDGSQMEPWSNVPMGPSPFISTSPALSLDNMPDGSTYLRMPGSNMDVNRRGLIDFTQGGHLGKIIDNIGDGATYGRTLGAGLRAGHAAYTADSGGTIHSIKGVGDTQTLSLDGEIADGLTYLRMPGANMDPARRALIDFTQAGHLGKSLANVPDDSGSSRYAVLAVDTNRRPLIDFTQGAHVGKVLDNIPDGTTYARTVASDLTSNRLDFSKGLLNKQLDNIPDGTTYIRGTASIGTATDLPIQNAFCSEPLNPDSSVPGWIMPTVAGSALYYDTGSPDTGYTQDLVLRTPTTPGALDVNQPAKFACVPGDSVAITARVKAASGVYSGAFINFLSASGGYLVGVNAATTSTSWTTVSAVGVAPAGTAYAQLVFYCSAPVSGQAYAALQWVRASINDVRVAGSGAQVGDQRNLLPILSAGAQAVWQNLSITYTAAAGSPATATISVTAAQILGLLAAGGLVSYNASSASVTGTGGTSPTYYLYYLDPAYSGGTQTLYATTNANDLRGQLGIVYIGSVVVAFPTSGSGSGSGGGGLCVADDMYVRPHRLAGAAQPGDEFDCVDFPTGQGKHVRKLLAVTRGKEQCVRLVAENGCALVCSISTPFDTVDGRELRAPDMLGERVLTDLGLSPLVKITPVGLRNVSRNHLGGVSYAAGELPDRRIYSHNTSTSKP